MLCGDWDIDEGASIPAMMQGKSLYMALWRTLSSSYPRMAMVESVRDDVTSAMTLFDQEYEQISEQEEDGIEYYGEYSLLDGHYLLTVLRTTQVSNFRVQQVPHVGIL
jgi:hypothetical protein